MFKPAKLLLLGASAACFHLSSQAAIIADFSNFDGVTVTGIDLDSTGEEVNSEATANPTYSVTSLATLNSYLSTNAANSYVVSNWGTGYSGNSNTLSDTLAGNITISENNGSATFNSTTANRASTGTNGLSLDIVDNTTITISFATSVTAAGFVIGNLGGAYDASDGTNPGFLTVNFYNGATIVSSQDWRAGITTTETAPENGSAEAYFGFISSSQNISSITINFQRDGNTGNGGVGFDDLAFAVPEPSTYAILTGVMALGFVMVRRRLRA